MLSGRPTRGSALSQMYGLRHAVVGNGAARDSGATENVTARADAGTDVKICHPNKYITITPLHFGHSSYMEKYNQTVRAQLLMSKNIKLTTQQDLQINNRSLKQHLRVKSVDAIISEMT